MDRPLRTTLEEMIEAHVSRRAAVKGILAAGGAMTATWCLPQDTRESSRASTLRFVGGEA